MKAEELRIGNYWTNGDKTYKVEVSTLFDITTAEDKSLWQPIPLTQEWLVKFGFENRYTHTYFKDKLKFDFSTNGVVRFHWSQKVTYIDYVHQLQNLYFALKGEEL